MQWIRDVYSKIVWRIIRNRSGYTDSEIDELKRTKWLIPLTDMTRSFYWFKVEMVKTNRCTVGWKEGDRLYFDFTGMLLRRKSPCLICPHAIAALSPVMYTALDRIGRGADPTQLQFDHVCCTDPGYDKKGLGNNIMRITCEKVSLWDYLMNMLPLQPFLFYRAWKARGTNPGGLA
ncbi:MAG: TIGR04076 family protein [Deltaproteobacteria bacterium]|nr:TIGR04076 family protein [Deltaproteobacteria bacterium]